ncbi:MULTISPECIES: elongation factor P hydroxylase [unclassified Legionella]|uniref:elongation factor P hydroxylase n=1 Tax=unclassified Legionella TaxID=2622702 RepID=UPI0010557BE8|nr:MULTISPECIES: elongation factor P hydroxylase [unclassified Legionella]MDI9819588.1 elongation factor P hydroxylase [Legionella sp. PL877]
MSKTRHQYQDLIAIFNSCFESRYNTKLVRGNDEPLYLPADATRPFNAIFFAHGFFSSALHECAHWLIAGKERRKQVDYGYWYVADGRNAEQQSLFQRVEVKPQALEWILSMAAGYRFRISVDNLNGAPPETEAFKQAIHQQVLCYCEQGLPRRAAQFREALCQFYETAYCINSNFFEIEDL